MLPIESPRIVLIYCSEYNHINALHTAYYLAQRYPNALIGILGMIVTFIPEYLLKRYADNPVPMPTADPEQFKTYQVPDEFMRVYKTLSTATEMMKNTWKRVLKNNQSYLSDPEKQKVLRFAMQRPALYLNELEACMEQILAETLEEAEKTA